MNLSKLANANSKQLWAAVKSSINSGSSSHAPGHILPHDVHVVNDFLPTRLLFLEVKDALRLNPVLSSVLKFS